MATRLNVTYARRRVVITGMGLSRPNGSDLTPFGIPSSRAISAGAPVTRF